MKTLFKAAAVLTVGVMTTAWSASEAQARELKFSLLVPEHHVFVTEVAKPFAARLDKESGGELKVTLYPSAVLGAGKEQLRLTETGVADIALIVPSYTRGRFPRTESGLLPFAFDSAAHGTRTLMALRGQGLDKEYDTVKLLFPAMTSPVALLTRSKPIAHLSDLRGISLRGTGGAQKAVLSEFGVNLVSMPASDLYVAMERGTIEGTVLSLASAPGYKLEELVKYVNRINFSATPIVVAMNPGTWQSLTPAQQTIVMAAADQAAANTGKAYDGEDEKGLETLRGKGAQVVDFPAEEVRKLREAAKPEWKSWTETLNKQGVDGEAFMAAFEKAAAAAQAGK
ncbi:MAG: TRAP transporter substrate-binding protein [Burkholderiaceae bacterium]